MRTSETLLLDFIRQSSQFRIPFNQRRFAWTQRECRQLWEDILDAGERADVREHFLGPVMYLAAVDPLNAHWSPYLVYDGQQRLTTVSLILEALARHLRDDTAPDGFEPAQIRNDYLLNALRKGDHQYRLLLKPGDSETLLALIHDRPRPASPSPRMRRAVCGYKPAAPPPVFARASGAIEPDRYVESVRAYLLNLPDGHAFPSDDAFRAELTTRNMYRFRHRDAVLERLENHGRKETVQLASYTVDHIMPQGERLPEAWKAELGPDWAQVWHTWRHALGNLTCTAFNSEMGNCSFSEKRDAERGFRDSPLRLNADLRETERWDESAIRARAARLADRAVEIWRRPVLTDRVLTSYKTPRAGAGRYAIEHHPHLRPGAPMHDLFEAVRQEILALGPQVREEFRRHYVAYKTHTNFVDVVPQKRRLLLSLNMRFDELGDPRGLAADITNFGRWGNGDVQVELDNERQITCAMELVRQAFAAKQPGGDTPAS